MGWWTGRTRGRGLWSAVTAVLLLVAMTALPSAAAASVGARVVTGVRADDTPGPSGPPVSPSEPDDEPDPQPTDTETDDDTPSPSLPSLDPSLTPPDQQVEAPTSFTMTGTDFDCADGPELAGPLTFEVEGRDPASLTVDDHGGFKHDVTVPADTEPGTYHIRAYCSDYGEPVAEATYEVLPPESPETPDPSISLDPDSGDPGTDSGVHGEGFLCDEGAGVDVLWDGEPATTATPDADGTFDAGLTVPSTATEGEHEVTVSCQSPQDVQDSKTFTVNPPSATPSTEDTHDVTIHLTDYPAACTRGAIVIGGRRLDTWLDEGSTEGAAGAGRWEFIDLHAHLPADMTGHREVDLDCPGRAREKAGEIDLPSTDELKLFELPLGSFSHPEGPTGPITPSPTSSGSPDPTESTDPSHSASPSPSESRDPCCPGGGGTGHDAALDLVGALRTPADVSWALKDLAGSVAMAAWFLLLVLLLERAFPSQLADNAISRWWQRRQAPEPKLPGWARMFGFALLGGSLAVWSDASTGLSTSTAVRTVGAAAGILMVLMAYEKTKDSLRHPRRGGFRTELRVVPVGLLLAALMALMSRFLEFPVPYVYGLVAVYIVSGSRRPGPDDGMPRGQAALIGGICVLAASVLVWVLGAPLIQAVQKDHDSPGSLRYVIAYTLGLMVVGGIEVVVFGLLPLSGMDGHHLKDWNKFAWFALYLIGLTFFFHVLLNSLHPGVGKDLAARGDLRWWTVGIATALFLAAGAFSLLLRWYVARDARRNPPTRP
ncbi:FGLLP motif-containing membrane protein [Streptomyces sp. NPDC086549]|uniref:FGLLP motif-containing membrane protein n=1 Tax=Streptomyces sp. NPDC086549 TaxID=3365752 RepID=UPI0037F39531